MKRRCTRSHTGRVMLHAGSCGRMFDCERCGPSSCSNSRDSCALALLSIVSSTGMARRLFMQTPPKSLSETTQRQFLKTEKAMKRKGGMQCVISALMFSVAATSFGVSSDDNERWGVEGITWWVTQIEIGDHDSSAFVARHGQDAAMTLYAMGSSTPRFHIAEPDSVDLQVAIAERASVAAGLVVTNEGTLQNPDLRAQLRSYSTYGDGTPEWTYDFPAGQDSQTGAGVAVSRDGSIIAAAFNHTASGGVLIEVFGRDGSPISSTIVAGRGLRDFQIDDEGQRALMQVGVEAVVIDLASGDEEARVWFSTIYEPLTLSGDGNRFAYGYWDGVRGTLDVYDRADDGSWSLFEHKQFRRNTIVTDLDLDQDGDRLAFFLQDVDMESFAVMVRDLERGRNVLRHDVEAPGTELALFGSRSLSVMTDRSSLRDPGAMMLIALPRSRSLMKTARSWRRSSSRVRSETSI